MKEKLEISIFWFRRDLRLDDNNGLYKALISGNKVLPIFIFDTEILNQLDDKFDRRVDFIFSALESLNSDLHNSYDSGIQYFYGATETVFLKLIEDYRGFDFGTLSVDAVEFVYNDWYLRKEFVKPLHIFGLNTEKR